MCAARRTRRNDVMSHVLPMGLCLCVIAVACYYTWLILPLTCATLAALPTSLGHRDPDDDDDDDGDEDEKR
jgi:hypothetical protein